MKTSFAALALAGLVVTVVGCAKPEEPKPAPTPPAATSTPPAADAPKAEEPKADAPAAAPATPAAEAPKAQLNSAELIRTRIAGFKRKHPASCGVFCVLKPRNDW